jgi:hypothetical protein
MSGIVLKLLLVSRVSALYGLLSDAYLSPVPLVRSVIFGLVVLEALLTSQ